MMPNVGMTGALYSFTIPHLDAPVCQTCGQKVFTEKVDDQINAALRSHLHLLRPEEIRTALERVRMTQKEAADRLGIAEATLSRWLNETQIQSRAMDNWLRVFFAFPQVCAALDRQGQDLHLGIADMIEHCQEDYPASIKNPAADGCSWLDASNGEWQRYQKVQEVVQQAGTTWGKKRVA